MTRTLACLALTLCCAAPAFAQDDPAKTKPQPEARWAEIAKCRAILVCTFERRDSKHFSGMAGSTLWFRVKEVIRFEGEPGLKKDGLWSLNYRTLLRRSRDLEAHRLLEWSLLYPARDKKAAARDAALCKRFPDTKQTFVLALSTTAKLSTSGTVVRFKWGAIHAGSNQVLIAPLTPASRPALKKALESPLRAPEHVRREPKAPRAPALEEDLPGGRRGRGGAN